MTETAEPAPTPQRTRPRRRLTLRGRLLVTGLAAILLGCVVTVPVTVWAESAGVLWLAAQQLALTVALLVGGFVTIVVAAESRGAFTTTEDDDG